MSGEQQGFSLDRVHVWRGERHVLRGVSLALRAQELMQIVGPNGAGKTTLLRVACGLLRPEEGQVIWRGRSIASVRTRFQATLAYAAHEPALKSDLTAVENLRYMVGLRRRIGDVEIRATLERAGVGACADLPVRVLSAGQRRRVSMARVLAMRASIWMLDEPFANLDAAGVDLVSALLADHSRAGGMAMIVAHHDVEVGGRLRRLELAA